MTLTSPGALTDKNLYAYCDNNPISRVDRSGEFWHIIAGAVAGAVINAAVKVASNLISGEKWSKDLGTAIASGAASGAIASTGIGTVGLTAASASIAMAENVVNQITEGETIKTFEVEDILVDGAIGAVFGAMGRKGNGSKHMTNLGKETVSRTVSVTKHKGLKAGFKESVKAFSYYGKNSAYYYKSVYSEIWKDVLDTCASSVAMSEYMKSQYYRAFGG